MDVTTRHHAEREAQRAEANRAELIERIAQVVPADGEGLAQEPGMSVSRFHHHFRAVTALSPLQFQKHLRLQEARRLMLGEGLDAASAGFRVGYGNAAHFTREGQAAVWRAADARRGTAAARRPGTCRALNRVGLWADVDLQAGLCHLRRDPAVVVRMLPHPT